MFAKKETNLEALDWRQDRDLVKLEQRRAELDELVPQLEAALAVAEAESALLAASLEEVEALSEAGRNVDIDVVDAREAARKARHRAIVARVDHREALQTLEQTEADLAQARAKAQLRSRAAIRKAHSAALDAFGRALVEAALLNHQLMDIHKRACEVWPSEVENSVGTQIYDGLLGLEAWLVWPELVLADRAAFNGVGETKASRWLAHVAETYGVSGPLQEAGKHGAAVTRERDPKADPLNPKFAIRHHESVAV